MTSGTGQHLPWVTRRTALLGLAAAAVIAAIAILALGGSSSGRHHGGAATGGRRTVVQRAAGYLGISPAEVRQRLRQGETLAQVAAAKKGASRQGLIDALYASEAAAIRARHISPADEAAQLRVLRRTLTSQVDHARRRSGLIRSAAAYLGTSETALAKQLAGGRTLAQIASSTPGRSRAGLVDALVATRRRAIEQARAEKAVSATVARRALARLRSRAERQLQLSGG